MSEQTEILHTPVMSEQVLAFSRELGCPPEWGLDVTFGRGGHTAQWLQQWPTLKMVAMDRDGEAILFGEKHFAADLSSGRLRLVAGSFHELEAQWGVEFRKLTGGRGFDLMLADLGVSSPQLDTPERGFSFYHDGPLDMRMDRSQKLDAASIVNTWSERELVRLFQEWGEINRPLRVVRALVHDRKEKPFRSTLQLARLIERVDGWHHRGHHPATRYFLALRLAVNDEISGLRSALDQMVRLMAPGGRMLVITFHSLEDRIVKYAMREWQGLGRPLTKKVIVPTDEECASNPRSRSAKLRVFERFGEGVGREVL